MIERQKWHIITCVQALLHVWDARKFVGTGKTTSTDLIGFNTLISACARGLGFTLVPMGYQQMPWEPELTTHSNLSCLILRAKSTLWAKTRKWVAAVSSLAFLQTKWCHWLLSLSWVSSFRKCGGWKNFSRYGVHGVHSTAVCPNVVTTEIIRTVMIRTDDNNI